MARPASDSLFLSFQLALTGRYSIDRELGRGGMGVVYLARDVDLDRFVAIKLLPPEKAHNPALRERFLREARLAAKLSHPHVVPIYAVDDVGGFVFYVMAYIDGETLAQRIRVHGPLSASEGARVLREVAWALGHAHAQGLVHRDVKPDNILLERASGRALVADFGIAAATGDATGDGVAGTPEFMSPEQALGREVDARSDLYGLGATAFYALSGRLPFEGKSATEVLAKQITEPPPPLASVGLPVPRKLALVIDRCLAKDPAHRPPTADALAEQFGLALEQRRELPAALRAFVKRNGRLDGAGTLLGGFVTLLAGVGASGLIGAPAGAVTLVAGMAGLSFGYLVAAARRLARMGFTHQDLGPAFQSAIELSREEHAVEQGETGPALQNGVRRVARVSMALVGVTVPLAIVAILKGQGLAIDAVLPVLAGIGVLAMSSGLWYLMTLQARRDIDSEFWSALWMGRVGQLAFTLARRSLGRRVIGPAMTHRATELSLGLAAEQLFESLPKESRQALGDLPGLLHRLQADAQTLRRRYDQLEEALTGAHDPARAAEYADLRGTRDEIHVRLVDAVSALETIRLNLLRLHAGSATVEGLTTQLGIAAEVSAEVERLVEAQSEVERTLRFPRSIRPSPA